MVANFLWGTPGTVMNLLTTELNALANGTYSAAGPTIDNATTKFQLGSLYLHVASATFVANSYVNVLLVPEATAGAGTTFPVATSANLNNYLVGTIYIRATTAAQDEVLPQVPIPQGKFKAYLVPLGSCPNLGATGNTLDLYPTPNSY